MPCTTAERTRDGEMQMIKESGENYLETILLLERRNGIVRLVDIANELGVSKPSVNRAMGVLKRDGYVLQELYGDITLTQSGRERANAILKRHKSITDFLSQVLGVDSQTAENDACRIEHVISQQTAERMIQYMKEHQIAQNMDY